MNRMIRLLSLAGLAGCAWLAGLAPSNAATPGTNASPPKPSIPYVPTRHDAVRDLLWMAEVGTNDVVYDLGSGDGRVVIAAVRDFHARRAVGIELEAKLVQESREKAVQAGVADRVEFIQGDLFSKDFSAASVVVLYLGQSANLDLRAQLLRTLKPGARVVSHQFGMGEWTPDKTLDVRTQLLGMYGEMWNQFKTNPDVPDFDNTGSRASHDVLSAWMVPAPVAGVWRGQVPPECGGGELKLTLHQRLSGLSGSFQWPGPTSLGGSVQVDLWGDHVRCWCIPTNQNAHRDQMWVDGRLQGDTLSGGLRMWRGTNTVEVEWAARRDHADFAGTWEWPGSSNAPVQFKLERRDGRLTATYADQNRTKNAWVDETKPIPVFDLYDFEGGFYFTLLLGLEGNRFSGGPRRMGPDNGWVIGEAVMEDGTLKGTIAFYPYSERMGLPTNPQAGATAAPPGRRDWQPKRVGP
jgi:SAM-dependent methyltransferase